MPGMGGLLMTGLRSTAKSSLLPEHAACLTAILSTLTSFNPFTSCAREDEKRTSAKENILTTGKAGQCSAQAS